MNRYLARRNAQHAPASPQAAGPPFQTPFVTAHDTTRGVNAISAAPISTVVIAGPSPPNSEVATEARLRAGALRSGSNAPRTKDGLALIAAELPCAGCTSSSAARPRR